MKKQPGPLQSDGSTVAEGIFLLHMKVAGPCPRAWLRDAESGSDGETQKI